MKTRNALALAPLLLCLGQAVDAATITVADGDVAVTNGDGRCSLIEALLNANATGSNRELSGGDCVAGSAGGDVLALAPNAVYVLTQPWATSVDGHVAGLPAITSAITITGSGALLLRGASDDNCASNRFRHLHVAPGGALQLSGVELRWGCADGDGGAILNRGSLALSESTLRQNRVQSSNAGGGLFIASAASATLVNTTLVGNRSGTSGGAIHSDGALTIVGSTIDGNAVTVGAGGGLVSRGTLAMRESLVVRNTTTGAGAGLDIGGTQANLGDVDNTTVTDNRSDGTGAGVHAAGPSGFVIPAPVMRLRSSTVANNTSPRAETGIGVYRADSSSTLEMSNTLLVDNRRLGVSALSSTEALQRNCRGINNIIGNLATDNCALMLPSVSYPLRALADHGGPSATLAPREALPVIGTGNTPAASAVSTVDQRGAGFPRVIDTDVDTGAFELFAGDADNDGAIDEHEAMAANAGDGNADSTADSGQAHVASRPVAQGSGMVTIEAAPGRSLQDVAVAPSPLDPPLGAVFPFGQVSFAVDSPNAGATVAVVVSLPQDTRILGFYVRDDGGNWQDIADSVTHSGGRTRIALSLTDGSTIDRDGSSSVIAVFAETRTPGTPDGLIAITEPGSTQISVRWARPSATGGLPLLGYLVEQRVDGDSWSPATGDCTPGNRLNSLATTCSVSAPSQNGAAYEFRVAARNELGLSQFGSSVQAAVQRPAGEAILLFVDPRADRTLLSWQAPLAASFAAAPTGYMVEMREVGSGSWVAAGGTCGPDAIGAEPRTSCQVLLADTATARYDYRLRTASAAGQSPSFALSGLSNRPEQPGTPTAVAGDTQVALSWSAPAGSSNAFVYDYIIERNPSGGGGFGQPGGSCADAVISSTTSCVDSGLSNGVQYRYRVRARNLAGTTLPTFLPGEEAVATPAAAMGSNDLLALSAVNANITPAFAAATLDYSLSVPNTTSSIVLRASSVDPAASITVEGDPLANGAESAVLPLAVGANAFEVVVNATTTYTLTVTRSAAPVAADFASIDYTAAGSTSSIGVNATSHDATFANDVTTVSLDVAASEPDALISLNGTTVGTGSVSALAVPLAVGDNVNYLRVESADGSDFRSIGLNWKRRQSSLLSALTSADGNVVAGGSALEFSLAVPHAQSQVRLVPTAVDAAGATITVDGQFAASGQPSPPISVNPGSNALPVVVTGREGQNTSYTVTVNRAADTRLLGLGSPLAMISPAFATETLAYSINVSADVSSLPLRGVLSDSQASLSIGGISATNVGVVSVPLAVGANSIPVVVTGTDGGTRSYTVTVNRGLPNFVVTPSAGSGGNISPSTPQSVLQGVRTSFVLSADGGFRIAAVGGTCGGSLGDSVYTTNPVSANCTVEASFEADTMVPGVPQNVSGSSGDGQIAVTWTAPTSNGGSTITGYTASATPVAPAVGGTATCTAAGNAAGCSILGLINGVAYTVAVTASNAEGTGNAGTAAQPVTPLGSPSAPGNVTATLTGSSTALIGWDTPASNGGSPIQSYAVVSTPAGAACSSSGNPPLRACAVSGLVDGQTYTFAVTASNSLRTSQPGVSAPLFVGAGVDLTVSVRRSGEAGKGATRRYLVEVTNNGARLVDGIRLLVHPARGLDAVTWTCVAPGGCTPGSGTASVDAVFGLGVGQVASIEVSGELPSGEDFVQLLAEASLPSGVTAVLRQDDRVMFTDTAGANGVLLNGFE